MTSKIPLLPLGMNNFAEMMKKKAVYVDKTGYIPRLREAGKVIFCARPRRFGKSLTVSTLDAFHSGRSELFHGLAAGKLLGPTGFVPRPVIRLDMNGPAGSASKELLEGNIKIVLEGNAARHGVELKGVDSKSSFFSLMEEIAKRSPHNKVVLLIDEYDAPIISLVQRNELLRDERLVEETREVMRGFYSQIKSADEFLEFTFITGVTKFSRMGVFSTLNNLVDISLRPEFAAFMGLTQGELETRLAHHVKATAKKLRTSERELLRRVRDHYDGFSFDGETRLYNPFSTLSFFGEGEFDDFWMESGSNSLIRTFLKDKALTVDQFHGLKVSRRFARSPGEIEATPPHGFLYQAGYLTLRRNNDGSLALDYPNLEVISAISGLFLDNLMPSGEFDSEASDGLRRCLKAGNVPGLAGLFFRLYAGISYDDHAGDHPGIKPKSLDAAVLESLGESLPEEARRKLVHDLTEKMGLSPRPSLAGKLSQKGESFYRSILQACLWGAGAQTIPEKHQNKGRLDLEVRYGGNTFVFEMKTARNAKGTLKAAQRGMLQIRQKAYGLAQANPILVSLAVDKTERNIGACVFEKDGLETTLGGQELARLARTLSR